MAKSKVKVILAADCYVGGVIRSAGDVVEVSAEVAEFFGTPAEAAETLESLVKLGKKKLLELAAERGVETVTKDNNADEIAAKILGG
jgi:hypothetical protein